jgi:AbrB family looped-hinge helix DNA binding protein
MATATITSKGQITLPAEVRKRLNLKTGDQIDFVLEPGGALVIRTKRKPFERLRGMLKSPHRTPPTVEEMDAAVSRGLAQDDERIRRQWNERLKSPRIRK